MKKIVKIGFPILCIAIIVATFIMLADIKGKVEENKSKKTKETNETVNEVENEVENEVVNEVREETGLLSKTEESVQFDKAAQILKGKVTISNNQYITNENEEDGRYIIAIRNKETTEAEVYYIVDVETGEYEIYY